MLKSGSINQKISKRLLMLSGTSFTPNLIYSSSPELKLFSQVFQLVTSLHNTSLIEISSVPVEFKRMISKELLRLLELSSRQLLEMDFWMKFLELAVSSRRFSSEMKDITCSPIALRPNQAHLYFVVVPVNILKRLKDPSMMLSWLLEELSSLRPSLPVEVPSKWSFQDIWENILDQLRERNSLSSTAMLKPLRQSQEPSPKTVVWTPLIFSTNSVKNMLQVMLKVCIMVSMFWKTAAMTCIKNLYGNLKKLELMSFRLLPKPHVQFWA